MTAADRGAVGAGYPSVLFSGEKDEIQKLDKPDDRVELAGEFQHRNAPNTACFSCCVH
jgi:hypothetical protein